MRMRFAEWHQTISLDTWNGHKGLPIRGVHSSTTQCLRQTIGSWVVMDSRQTESKYSRVCGGGRLAVGWLGGSPVEMPRTRREAATTGR